MAQNEIKTQAIGNIGRDAVTRDLPGGRTVTTFSLAVNFDKSDGSQGVDWLKINIWGRRGASLAKHLTEGKLMLFRGTPAAEAWLDKQTQEVRSQLVLNVNPSDDLLFLDNIKRTATEPAEESEIPF